MKIIWINLFLLLAISLGSVSSQELSKGSSCTVQRTQSPGTCKIITECSKAIENIPKRIKNTRCGFEGLTEIVCCPNEPTKPPTIANRMGISQEKCMEYKSAVYEHVYSLALTLGSERVKLKVDKCGHKVIPLIVGGEFAKPREFPHMALVGFDGEDGKIWTCGGSLISERYVLTAGHCTKTIFYGDPKYVCLGELDTSRSDDDAQPEEFNVIEVIAYPNYTIGGKYHDIALLKLDRDVSLNPYKRPICLPTSFEGDQKQAIATGWGHTEWSGQSSNHLQKVTLDKFTQEECNTTYQYSINRKLANGITYETQICAGSRNESKDTCQGDSGGPLQVFHPTEYCMYTIIGVTSFGIACGNVGVPGVYTRVFPYIDWIEKIVWGN